MMAVAILGAIVISLFAIRLNDAISAIGLTPEEQSQILSQSDKLGGIVIPDTFNETDRILSSNVVRESFVYGFRWAMGVCAVLALAAAVVSFFSIHSPPLASRPFRPHTQ
jgi:hypothetical protein